jgi:hypothetical protein
VSDRIRFHLDEPVDPDVARALRKHGIDVTTTQEAGLRTRPDSDQLGFTREQGRVIVTHDADESAHGNGWEIGRAWSKYAREAVILHRGV